MARSISERKRVNSEILDALKNGVKRSHNGKPWRVVKRTFKTERAAKRYHTFCKKLGYAAVIDAKPGGILIVMVRRTE